MYDETIISEKIIYEQPLNEPMRICLRLEQLFNQLKHYINRPDPESSKHALISIAKILDVIKRPDLKSKLAQTLTQHATTLGQIERFPQVDPERLQDLLKQLDSLISNFHHQTCRIGERLRNNEFLNNIRLRLGNPGGACLYSIPAFTLWLEKSTEIRFKDLNLWTSEFNQLQQIVNLILHITRNSGETIELNATNGFYHQTLNPTLPCEIIRINLPTHYNVFPEFSVGRHRLSIRFLVPNYHDNGHPTQSNENLLFELTCCRV